MAVNMEQHLAFEKGIENLNDYCVKVQGGQEAYDPNKVLQVTRGFGEAFVSHLHDEIDTLAPEHMALIYPKAEDYQAIYDKMLKWAISGVPKAKMLPWVNQFLSNYCG